MTYSLTPVTNLLKTAMIALAVSGFGACSGSAASTNANASSTSQQSTEKTVAFDVDSAMSYLKAQVDFGPRVPGSDAHSKCGDWLVDKLKSIGADTVIIQKATVKGLHGENIPIRNIIGRFNTSAAKRALLLAHWDTRPWADEDSDPANHNTPIDGANDGASGVAVLLEIARNIKANGTQSGVDILFTDAEDGGLSAPDDADAATIQKYEDTWCRGTQYFVANPPYENALNVEYAILLDMVGGRDAIFPAEYFSYQSSPRMTERVIRQAQRMGVASRFPRRVAGAINDDHVPLIKSGIQAIDIIEAANAETGGFNPTWHTLNDNITNIDPATIDAVGRVVTAVINE